MRLYSVRAWPTSLCEVEQVYGDTVEPLYCGHLGGPGEVSCIQWNPFIVDTLRTW